jgi:hypothetical protein
VTLLCSPTRGSIEPTSKCIRLTYTLNDDVLLKVFDIYRLAHPDQYVDEDGELKYAWDRQHRWYKLTHLCRQWRNLISISPSHVCLNLVCTYGVPVANMLAHSPPLSLTIYYPNPSRGMTTDDESGILLALSYLDRVHRIFFCMPSSSLAKFITATDDQFSILERMHIRCLARTEETSSLVFPVTFQAPNLRNLILSTASLPIGSPLLTTTPGIAVLILNIPASVYFPPSYIQYLPGFHLSPS